MDKTNIPEQQPDKELEIKTSVFAKSTIAGTFVATIAGFLPGFGSSQAAILGQQLVGFGEEIGDKGFLVMVGGINTANMLTSIATVFVLGKARNGAIIAVNKIIGIVDLRAVLIFLFALLAAAGIASILALKISRIFSKFVVKVNYTVLISMILLFIVVLTVYFDGFLGFAILAVATSIGVVATKLGVGKNHLMGCLILPVILYFVM